MYYALLDNGHGIDTKGKRSPDGLILEYSYTRELAAAIYERLSISDTIKPILITPERKSRVIWISCCYRKGTPYR